MSQSGNLDRRVIGHITIWISTIVTDRYGDSTPLCLISYSYIVIKETEPE